MLTEKDMWGMSPIDQMICRIQFRRATYKGFYTPPTTDTRWIQYPGYNGGSDWGGIAVDPRRGVIVANYNDMPNYRSEEHTSELQSLMRISYAVFCLKKKNKNTNKSTEAQMRKQKHKE